MATPLFPFWLFLSCSAVNGVISAPAPTAMEFWPDALAFLPRAVALSAVALALAPTAIDALPVAFAPSGASKSVPPFKSPEPIAIEDSPLASVFAPTAVDK